MSEHTLPEDLSRWPSDPFQLLGVQPGVGPRELRRIYTQLIRTYKPEQFPEHFRRIREAYENVLRQVEFWERYNIRFVSEVAQAPADPSADSPGEPSPPPESVILRPWQPVSPPTSELDELWERACRGEEAEAYRRLVAMHEQRPGETDVCLRLYWLLALTPELDPGRTPCHWLAQGLFANGLTGPLRELYRREIAFDPAEALGERATRLLHMTMNPAQLADLAEWRWQAAGRQGNWRVIDDDLEILYDRLAGDEPETWVRLLISAGEQLAALDGGAPRELLGECWRQIERHPHCHNSMADVLDRFEFVCEVADSLRKLRQKRVARGADELLSPRDALVRLIPLSWSRPFPEVRPLLLAYLKRIADDPLGMIAEFDQVQEDASAVLTQFGNLLTLLEASLPYASSRRPPEEVERLLICFMAENDWHSYRAFRLTFLDFCLQESIRPEALGEVSNQLTLVEEVNRDYPLRYVCLGYRLFWQ